jgi:hypothetical protein
MTEDRATRYTRHTHSLPDGRQIETEAERRGNRLRLRARLIDSNGIVQESLRRTYDPGDANAVADFEAEFARITGITLDRPLFPGESSSVREVAVAFF